MLILKKSKIHYDIVLLKNHCDNAVYFVNIFNFLSPLSD